MLTKSSDVEFGLLLITFPERGMNFRLILFLCLISILFSDCTPSVERITTTTVLPEMSSSPKLQTTNISTSTPTSTITLTSQPKLAYWPAKTATLTSTNTIKLSPTSTHNWVTQSTLTPQPPAKCPVKYDALNPTPVYFGYLDGYKKVTQNTPWPPDDYFDVENNFRFNIADFLTKYGPKQILQRFHTKYLDLTNDGIPDLVLRFNYLSIYTCKDGKYIEAKKIIGDNPGIIDIQDANRDGIPELFLSLTPVCFILLEWNGESFQNILSSSYPNIYDESDGSIFIEVQATGRAWFEDVDHDGIKEIVVDTGLPITPGDPLGLPLYRNIHRIFHWDGRYYSMTNEDYANPVYRFQAVQDGDRKSQMGDYEKAFSLYQNAVFDNKLEWWTIDRYNYVYDVWNSQFSKEKLSTPVLPTQADPYEYPNLAAYARYRIMLLHVIQGHLGDAKTVYDTLQAIFPQGQPGSEYADMAKIFWEDYQSSRNITEACRKAIDYAHQNPAVLQNYIGDAIDEPDNWFHGDPSIKYKPEDICPF